MAKISRQIKEIINTVLFLLAVAVILIAFVIYPLKKTHSQTSRPDFDDYEPDSLAINDPTAFIETGLQADSFRVEPDGLTLLACVYLTDSTNLSNTSAGTVFLLHGDGGSRDDVLELSRTLIDSGFTVVAYDQRASARSSGKYRSDGSLEGEDLLAIISHLNFRDRIVHPVVVVGTQLGADAGMLASLEAGRIDGVAAIDPYLTTKRMQNILKEKHDTYWFPFYRSLMWFWYKIRSGYAPEYRKIDDIKEVSCQTLMYVDSTYADDEEVNRIKELSDSNLLTVYNLPTVQEELTNQIIGFVMSFKQGDSVSTQ